MYRICKITSNPVVDFAAEELKKYLRMMMPRCGEIEIVYAPDATDGFRLGLMSDFGLDTYEAEDLFLDDILHVDTDTEGGVIAGSNPRSVLQAVYRYLMQNGCRWLFPGVDGEYIPIVDIKPVQYHKMADTRVRAQCNEGAESQTCMLETIDFSPKIGLNSYMIEFDNPKVYYKDYYNHRNNEENREPEPVSDEQVLQWKRQCEVEIAKRGLIFNDMGHGWTAEPFGLDTTEGWTADENAKIPEESREYVAMMNGVRGLYKGVALNTNFCMSNPKARTIVAKAIADYAESSRNVDFLHVWLADANNNHCECEECRKKTVSDWYVMMLNELDAILTDRGLPTRIVYIVYYDTSFPPTTEKLNNPARFSMLMAAITRSYTSTPEMVADCSGLRPFNLNQNIFPNDLGEYMAYGEEWQKSCPAPRLAYEYHFWWHQFCDVGGIQFARRIYEDNKAYRKAGYQGIIQDGSQRSFWPNGFSFWIYGETLFDGSRSFEELVEDYFSHAYGEHWQEIVAYLTEISRRFDVNYLEVEHRSMKDFTDPAHAVTLRTIPAFVEEMEPRLREWTYSRYRVQTVAMRLLRYHAWYSKALANVFAIRADGDIQGAKEAYDAFYRDFGKCEVEIERYFDQCLARRTFNRAVLRLPENKPVSAEQQ